MKDKKLIAMLESILLWDFSDALQDNVAHCLSVYKWCKTPEEYEAKITKVIHAFELLPEKDKMVLEHLVFDKMSNIEVFDVMKDYVKPKPGSAPIEEWNNKKKSDTVSVWRDRAFIHLEDIYNDPRIK